MTIILDGEFLKNPEKAHEYIREKFNFPDYYGNNLDALYDCLTELYDDTEIIIENVAAADRDTEEDMFTEPAGEAEENMLEEAAGGETFWLDRILEVFRDAADDNDCITLEICDQVTGEMSDL